MKILTKTHFNSGIRCQRIQWLDINKTIESKPPSLADQLNIQRGREVEAKAQEGFNDIILIKSIDRERGPEETRQAIESGARKIAQPTLKYEKFLIRIDIFEKNEDDTWNIIEVKMSKEVKEEHILDIAFQRHVAELCGLKISNCFLMHLNGECIFPDLSNLFVCQNVNANLEEADSIFKEELEKAKNTIELSSQPEVPLGSHCRNPTCSYKDHCWKDVPTHSIYTIPRISAENIAELIGSEVLKVLDVPDAFKLPKNQSAYVSLIKGGVPLIDHVAIKSDFALLRYPLYFLDFETDDPPIPRLNGMSPFGLIPFQFSLHVLNENGLVSHFEFLHPNLSDPRELITEKLCSLIGSIGNIIVYNKSFEKRVLETLANFSDKHRDQLISMQERLWDLKDIFTKHYKHPNFAGSNSLKGILETLVPHLSYGDLSIQSGENASAKWVKLITSTDSQEQQSISEELKAYCGLDSFGMVEIYKHLTALLQAAF